MIDWLAWLAWHLFLVVLVVVCGYLVVAGLIGPAIDQAWQVPA